MEEVERRMLSELRNGDIEITSFSFLQNFFWRRDGR